MASSPDSRDTTGDSRNATSTSLLQRVRGNDQDAWKRLVGLYTPLLLRWCQRWGLGAADADDVAQEVFQAVFANIGTFRKERPEDTFRGWLYGVTRFKLLDYHRRKQTHLQAEGGSDAYERILQSPQQAALDDEEAAEDVDSLFHRALELIRGEFEDRTWQAFWRATVDEEKTADIAVAMQMTTAAVRKAKSRVLRRLREELGEVLE